MRRQVYVWIGLLCVGLGIAGILLPVVPGTVFLLLAAACFSKGSPRLHRWLTNHRHLGPPIRRWQSDGSIPLRIKVLATAMIAAGCVYPVFLSNTHAFFRAALGAVILAGLVYIWSRPSAARVQPQAE
jgi:uncharacterized membrane protein YbaN (DUF454 family)